MKVTEAYANKDTTCSYCKKIIHRNTAIALCYDKEKLVWVRCIDCYLHDERKVNEN